MTAIGCESVQKCVSDFIDGLLPSDLTLLVEQHLETCEECSRTVEALRNVIGLAGDPRLFEPPEGFSRRLYTKLKIPAAKKDRTVANSSRVKVGITEDTVSLGAHLLYLWRQEDEFAEGVRFLYPGLGGEEHCIIFGHTEALDRVQAVLSDDGFDPIALQGKQKLTVLHRHAANRETLAEIAFAVQRSMHSGSRCVRFLGNLGLEKDPLPAGENDVIELERKAGALIRSIPCVIVCMYDVKTVSGNLILKGGLEHHELSICNHSVHRNPFYAGGYGASMEAHSVQ